jgi:hypothetical protein
MHHDEPVQADVLIRAGTISTHADEVASAFRGLGVVCSMRSSVSS